jgi:hypothetical protein
VNVPAPARIPAAWNDTVTGMTDQPGDGGWAKLGANAGLCRTCGHAKLNETRRGTAYLRCTNPDLPRYPRLPVAACSGYRSGESS